MIAVQFRQLIALKDAQNGCGESLDRVFHFADQPTLQTYQVARQNEVEYLAPTVGKQFVAKAPARKQRVKMRAGATLRQHGSPFTDAQFAAFEVLDKLEFLAFERPERRQLAQRTLLAANLSSLLLGQPTSSP